MHRLARYVIAAAAAAGVATATSSTIFLAEFAEEGLEDHTTPERSFRDGLIMGAATMAAFMVANRQLKRILP